VRTLAALALFLALVPTGPLRAGEEKPPPAAHVGVLQRRVVVTLTDGERQEGVLLMSGPRGVVLLTERAARLQTFLPAERIASLQPVAPAEAPEPAAERGAVKHYEATPVGGRLELTDAGEAPDPTARAPRPPERRRRRRPDDDGEKRRGLPAVYDVGKVLDTDAEEEELTDEEIEEMDIFGQDGEPEKAADEYQDGEDDSPFDAD
jgi:hypothetical protein